MEKADVSVVIPAFQAQKTLERALQSVLRQTLLPREIIIIDDCSPDPNTQKFLSAIQENNCAAIPITILSNDTNKGPGFSRNRGILTAKSKFIAFLDADDWWLDKHLEIAFNAMPKCSHGLCVISSKPYQEAHSSLASVDASLIRTARMSFWRMFLFQREYHTISIIAPKETLIKAGLFAQDRKHAEDLELFFKMFLSETPWFYLSNICTTVLGKHAFASQKGLSANLEAMHKGSLLSLKSALSGSKYEIFYWPINIWFQFKFLRRVITLYFMMRLKNKLRCSLKSSNGSSS
jgi:teichuronic acid biosynthesis glycosyltransferase TuaG